MNVTEKLELMYANADRMLFEAYDPKREFPITAASHTDFWPGDASRWVDGYLAIDKPEEAQEHAQGMAKGVMNAVQRSIRRDGIIPHYMLGSHMRLGGRVETNIVDRYVQLASGNGLERSDAGEWVTTANAAPTAAIAALSLVNAGIQLPEKHQYAILDAHNQLTVARRNTDGLIEARNPNELTNNSGVLSRKLRHDRYAIDLAVNALYIKNARALSKLWSANDIVAPFVEGDAKLAQSCVEELLETEHATRKTFSLESTLAAARLGFTGMLREGDLRDFFKAPVPGDKHPERTNPALADALEVARLTSGSFEISRVFLGRIVTKLAENKHMFTRYEGAMPDANAIANRAYRRQQWVPTAAEARQIDIDMID